MKTKRFPQDVMERLAHSYGKVTFYGQKWNESMGAFDDDLVLEVLHNEQVDTTRWNSVHDLVFIDTETGEGYHTRYEQGLTESQMLTPFYYDKEGVDCDIVDVWEEQVTTTVIKWGTR
jgi:hypothetical protein